ncbi:hypothetical protein SELR_pSRC400160 (plasmid) [Selenomonas ruminantium subsp. lactilytica TAM6421]|uniref:Uncharacterized protein n=1 Tax=Selenomonas ruminantium subsp. lactilytica (strain NBRC 103574 / TAM6421) TaxID=927704 RepID=I0GV80_SELRL|nr:hypothetical protein SELR_pSRC400160 [Selenomonas ruminantium subsp. lactilytica TAM6421]
MIPQLHDGFFRFPYLQYTLFHVNSLLFFSHRFDSSRFGKWSLFAYNFSPRLLFICIIRRHKTRHNSEIMPCVSIYELLNFV